MYSVSANFLNKIKSNIRTISWSGTITTKSGSTYNFTRENIANGGSITRTISSQSIKVGTVCAASLSIELILPNVSRYELYGATVVIKCSVSGASEVIPMGTYVVAEATQASDHITIKAYDNMLKLDNVSFSPVQNTDIKAPYQWLKVLCSACGLTLGTTEAQLKLLPNGGRRTGFANVSADVKNWRDVLSYLTAYMGAFAYIGRDNKLYIASYGSESVDTIPSSFRYSSDLSDYRTTYDGISAIYKNGEIQEYTSNTNTNGLVIELGINPFLQFTNQANRIAALQEIIDHWDGIYYVSFDVDMPLIPIYDPGDIVTFTDKQAGEYDYGAITEITYKIDGTMHIKCAGENPKTASAQDRYSKAVSGLSQDKTNGQEVGGKDFWIKGLTNGQIIEVSGEEIQIAEIEYEQTTFAQQVEMILTVDAVLSAAANVKIRINVDGDTDLEMSVVESKSFVGERVFHCSNPQRIYGVGTHACKVFMMVTDSPVLVGDLL